MQSLILNLGLGEEKLRHPKQMKVFIVQLFLLEMELILNNRRQE